jgi:hypothetical protein
VRKIFQKQNLESQISKNGYVVLDVFSEKEIQIFTTLFNEFSEEIIEDFHSSHFSDKRNYKRKVNIEINQILKQKTSEILKSYEPIFSNFMVKRVSATNSMPLHADWTYVDESSLRSISCWIPLVDTTKENGALGVIPYSHLFKPNFRGPRIPSPFHDNNEFIIQKYGKLIPMKKGQCIFYDHRLLHFSPPNNSNKTRPAINVVFTPPEASIYHFLQTESSDETLKFTVSNLAFFTEYEHYKLPELYKDCKVIKQYIQNFSRKEIDTILKKNESIWQKIKGLFAGV